MFRVTVIVASSGRRESGHKKPEAQNMFFDLVIKVLPKLYCIGDQG